MYKTASRFQQITSRRNAFHGKMTHISRPGGRKRKVPKELQRALSSQETLVGVVEGYNKAGFLVKIEGYLGFCPYSLMYPIRSSPMEKERLIGQEIRCIVKRAKGNSVVVSQRAALRKALIKKMEAAKDSRTILDGTVTQIKEYGAFVDIGGIDGLVHISEVSEQWVGDLAKTLSIDSKVQVVVLEVDTIKGRLALSMRQVPR